MIASLRSSRLAYRGEQDDHEGRRDRGEEQCEAQRALAPGSCGCAARATSTRGSGTPSARERTQTARARALARPLTVAEVAVSAAVDLALLVVRRKDAHLHVDGVLPHPPLLSDAHRHRGARIRALLVLACRLVDIPLVAPERTVGPHAPAVRLRSTRDPLVLDAPDVPVARAARGVGALRQAVARRHRRGTAERTCLPGR